LGVCRRKLHWTVQNQWSSVIFTKTKIALGQNHKTRARYDERTRPYCLGLHNDWETNDRVSVMYWGCISYYGMGTLVPVEGNMNTEQYIST